MREFTKSLMGMGIATAVFSARQAGVILTRPPTDQGPHPATDAFNAMTQAAADQCGNGLRESIHTMDKIQRKTVDTLFQTIAMDNFNRGNQAETAANVVGQATQQIQQWFNEGCGPQRETQGPTPFDQDCNQA